MDTDGAMTSRNGLSTVSRSCPLMQLEVPEKSQGTARLRSRSFGSTQGMRGRSGLISVQSFEWLGNQRAHDADERLALSRPAVTWSGGITLSVTYKIRLSVAGVHLFDRISGVNVLLDEVPVPAEQFSHAPRYLSVVLPIAETVPGEHPLDAHMHIDATGVLRPHAYARTGLSFGGSIAEAVQAWREAR